MNSPENRKDFVQNHCTTLIPEPNSKGFFVKVTVADYNELQLIKTNLLTAIKLIADYNEVSANSIKSEFTHSIGALIQLLRNFGLEEESVGLSELIKESSHQ